MAFMFSCEGVSFSLDFLFLYFLLGGTDIRWKLTQPAPQRAACSHQDLLQLRARRVDALQLLSGVLLPTATLLGDLPWRIGKSGLASSRVQHSRDRPLLFRTPMVNGQQLLFGNFPYRETGVCNVMNP